MQTSPLPLHNPGSSRDTAQSVASSMQATTDSTVPTVHKHPAKLQPIAIDVEEYARKYEIHSDEIMAIDAETYRHNVMARGMGKGKERQHNGVHEMRKEKALLSLAADEIIMKSKRELLRNNSNSQQGYQPGSAPSVGHDYPSTIGPAIEGMKRNRSMAPQQQSTSNKRRRIDSPTSLSPSPHPRTSLRAQPSVASSSKLIQQPIPHQPSNAIAGPSSHPVIRHNREPSHQDDTDEIVILSSLPTHSARKRSKVASTPMASTSRAPSVQGPHQDRLQSKRPHEVIEISSDGEVTVSPRKRTKALAHKVPIEISSDSDAENVARKVKSAKKWRSPILQPKLEPKASDDNDEDDDWTPPGYDLNDSNTWKPLESDHDSYPNTDLAKTLSGLDIFEAQSEPVAPPNRHIPSDTTMFDSPLRKRKYIKEPVYIWDMLARVENVRIPPRVRPPAYQISRPYMPPWREDFDLYRMKRAFYDPSGYYELKKAPGSINRIVQKGSWTVIASACVGGLPDAPDEEPSPYNREGSLMTLHHELDIPRGHETKKSQPPRTKHYAVNDVQFDPLRKAFVSSGADRRLRLWDLQNDDENDEEDPNPQRQDLPPSRPKWTNKAFKPFDRVPHDLAFKPHTSILAVAEQQVRLYSLSQQKPEFLGYFPLYPDGAPHVVGSMAWGLEATSSHLFASSEPVEPAHLVGTHKAFDIQERNVVYQFDASEAGDTLCVGPTGSTFALSTRAPGNRHIIRLYDIARRNGKATSKVNLEKFPVRYPGFEGEVTSSSFSPDGLLLALARNDNQTHVYDLRAVNQGPLYKFEHTGECQASDNRCLYGVVKAQWLHSVRSRRIALVTGGEDGCVRVWDPSISAADPKNGVAIAHANSDIGHFSLGDPYAGEHQLVIGDCSGEISVFDNII